CSNLTFVCFGLGLQQYAIKYLAALLLSSNINIRKQQHLKSYALTNQTAMVLSSIIIDNEITEICIKSMQYRTNTIGALLRSQTSRLTPIRNKSTTLTYLLW